MKQDRRYRVARWLLGTGSFLLLAWGIAPLATSRIHVGCVALTVVGALGLGAALAFPTVRRLWLEIWHRKVGKAVLTTLLSLVGSLTVLFVVVSGMMVYAACTPPPDNATVIVLGAGLRGERPARMLAGRLDAAAAYLEDHPGASCVVSGGQNEDEIVSEAYAMRAYLMEKGIDGNRIYMEDESTSTYENLQYSKRVIEENGLNPAVAIATQEFHQLRGQSFAKRAGFEEVGAVTAHSPFYLLGSYWVRDFAGLCHMALLGY